MTEKHCLIISGGEFSGAAPEEKYDYIIACDKGYEYAKKLNIKPDLVIGDFDSYSGSIRENIPVIKLPTEKDDTDTGYAVRCAVQDGYDRITIICSMGGRFDHAFSNIQTASSAAAKGVSVTLIGANERICVLAPTTVSIPRLDGYSISVFSVSEICDGVTISGAKYETKDAVLTNTYPIGTSNEWKENEITISFRSGILMIAESRM